MMEKAMAPHSNTLAWKIPWAEEPGRLQSLGSRRVEHPAMWETWVRSLGWEDPLEKERLPIPVFWPGEFHGLVYPWDFPGKSTRVGCHCLLWAAIHGVAKSGTLLSD